MFATLLSLQLNTSVNFANFLVGRIWVDIAFELVKLLWNDGSLFGQPSGQAIDSPKPMTCAEIDHGNPPTTPCMDAAQLSKQFAQMQTLPVKTEIRLTTNQWQASTCYGLRPAGSSYDCVKLLANEAQQTEQFIGCVFVEQPTTGHRQLPPPGESLMVSGTIVDYRTRESLIWLSNCHVIR
jgi:hypothetical protein